MKFSLVTLFVWSALILMLVYNFYLSQKLNQSKQQLHRLGEELSLAQESLGILVIEDPESIAVREMDSLIDKVWKWNIHLPSHKKYDLHWKVGEIPKEGIPQESEVMKSFFDRAATSQDGNLKLELSLRKTMDEFWFVEAKYIDVGMTRGIIGEAPEWFDRSGIRFGLIFVAGKGRTQDCDADSEMVLFRGFSYKQHAADRNRNSGPGMMVWIEPAEEQASETVR